MCNTMPQIEKRKGKTTRLLMLTLVRKLRHQDLNVSISGMIFIVTGMIFTDDQLTFSDFLTLFVQCLFVHLSLQLFKILQNNWTIFNQTQHYATSGRRLSSNVSMIILKDIKKINKYINKCQQWYLFKMKRNSTVILTHTTQ